MMKWLLCLLICTPGFAAQRLVPSQYTNIQAAITAAASSDEIIISQGIYTGPGNRDLDMLNKFGLIIRSTNPTDTNTVTNTVINCQGSESFPHRGFVNMSNSSKINGITITNGWANDYGGGIYIGGSPSTNTIIMNCHLISNTANTSTIGQGGAIYTTGTNIQNCTVSSNLAKNGAGISGGDNKISSCIISQNSCISNGGGVWQTGGYIINCLIYENITNNSGGGIWASSATTIMNCTVVANTAANTGGGVNGSGWITNSILWGNSSINGKQLASTSATVSYCDIQGGLLGVYGSTSGWSANLNVDPLFISSSNLRLSAGSICIDSGNNFAYTNIPGGNVDIANNTRFLDDPGTPDNGIGSAPPIIDMGAYEFTGISSYPDSDNDGVPDINDRCPLTIPGIIVDAYGCPPVVPGDLDHDGDVDMDDFAILQRCISGPDIPGSQNCN